MLVSRQSRLINSPRDVAKIVRELLHAAGKLDREKEHFWLLSLNSKCYTKSIHLIHLGTLSSVEVHPREVFRPAILEGARSIIVAHNHPSGNPEPSDEDYALSWRLIEAGQILGIEVKDHVIVGKDGEYETARIVKESNGTE